MRKRKGKKRKESRLRYYVIIATAFVVGAVAQVFVFGRAAADSTSDVSLDTNQSTRISDRQTTAVSSNPKETPAILNHISNVPTSSVDRWQSPSDTTSMNFGIHDRNQIGGVTNKQATLLGDNSANLSSEKTLLVDDIALSSVGSQIEIQ